MGRIVIIARDRLTRAFIGGHLIEHGFEVLGADDIKAAVLQLGEIGSTPYLVILDTMETYFVKEDTEALAKLCPTTPLLLIRGATDYLVGLHWPSAVHVLRRPVSVGQIVRPRAS